MDQTSRERVEITITISSYNSFLVNSPLVSSASLRVFVFGSPQLHSVVPSRLSNTAFLSITLYSFPILYAFHSSVVFVSLFGSDTNPARPACPHWHTSLLTTTRVYSRERIDVTEYVSTFDKAVVLILLGEVAYF